jgi:phenylalanyl-tRNA synthetase beta subunit
VRKHKYIKKLNNLKLTQDEIRRIVGYNITDEQVEEIADFLSLFAIITYNNLVKDKVYG